MEIDEGEWSPDLPDGQKSKGERQMGGYLEAVAKIGQQYLNEAPDERGEGDIGLVHRDAVKLMFQAAMVIAPHFARLKGLDCGKGGFTKDDLLTDISAELGKIELAKKKGFSNMRRIEDVTNEILLAALYHYCRESEI